MAVPVSLPRRKSIEPAEDYGFFGPDSVTWRVWSYPTSLTVGFQRAVVVEELDPFLVASVDATRAIWDRPRTRYDRTLRYFALVAFGDSRSTAKAADVLVKVHSKAVGTEPLSGRRYDANDPDSQLWIHLTAWHSILYAYERYGPGKLSAEDEERYWRECAVAAELQTCDPADVPRTREGVRAYFERMRPRLVGSQVAKDTMNHLLRAEVMLPPLPAVLRPAAKLIAFALRKATLATMPRWMREMSGLRQSRVLDALVRPLARITFAAAHLSRRAELLMLGFLSPSTVSVVAPVLLGVPPKRPETRTPAQARERYGYAEPAKAHLELRARQAERALSGHRPSDQGIRESEPILGSTT
ncbi:oxygenase MpaB family protein [Amycolatopsis anabasis]|uniref:oxygenase MpaB family protein n=1 Tax=Amycolatopsis anabasis TaxID=1840409 RepID=UPI00131CCA59|nr:oxygenase MpaB family protein [Amycolatopsis anabasis]